MAGWFQRAKQSLRGEKTPAQPVVYQIRCRCGATLTGERATRSLSPRCHACQTQLLIFPRSVYPRPKGKTAPPEKKPLVARKPPPLPQQQSTDDHDADDLEVVEETAPQLPPAPGKSKKPKAAVKSPSKGKANAAQVRSTPRVSWSERRQNLVAAVQRKLTPVRLIAAGIVGTLIITSLWIWHQQAVKQAVITYAQTVKAGRAALSEGDLTVASQELQAATRALDLLGRTDREARAIRQLSREATAAAGLAQLGLFDLISEVEQARQRDPGGWAAQISQDYRGKWLLLESNSVQAAANASANEWASILLVAFPARVHVRFDVSRLVPPHAPPEPGQLLFAGQLAEVRASTQGDGWEIVLEPRTLCLWTDLPLLERVGWTNDETTRATLTQQAEWLGLAAPVEAQPAAEAAGSETTGEGVGP